MFKFCVIVLSTFFAIVQFCVAQSSLPLQNQVTLIAPYHMGNYNQFIQNYYQSNKEASSPIINNRLLSASSVFLGKPYYLGALGEGPGAKFDKHPLYRTDKFDCVTYIETVLALAESTSFRGFQDHILQIRYSDGIPTYLSRNHFTSIDWNPRDQKLGYITDSTKTLYPTQYKIAVANINKAAWYQHKTLKDLIMFKTLRKTEQAKKLAAFRSLGHNIPNQISKINYVPIKDFFDAKGQPIPQMFAKIPSGVIIEIIRPDWNLKKLIGTNLNVSHMGLGLRLNKTLYFREASSIKHKVIDTPLSEYLHHYLHSKTVKGINIELINLI